MSYTPTIWKEGDIITAQKLNKMEDAMHTILSDYIQTNWVDGDIITSEKLNKLEDAIAYVNLDYIKTTWENNDIITATMLNNMENGIEMASVDKTWGEMNWNDVIVATRTGKYETFNIGDLKDLVLSTGDTVQMQIVAIDEDDLEDDSGKAKLTFISKDSLKQRRPMNPQYVEGEEGTGSLGGWEKTQLRAWLKNSILPNIPANVRDAIKLVKKYSTSYNVSGSKVDNAETADDLWIPSEREMNGNLTNTETLGPIYSEAFNSDASRKKLVNGTVSGWWLRTAGDTAKFKDVSGQGVLNDYNSNAQAEIGVTLCFCL